MQSDAVQRFARLAPPVARAERTLSDVVERAIAAGGASPQQVGAVDPAEPVRMVDKRV
jgi:hypothetical protein